MVEAPSLDWLPIIPEERSDAHVNVLVLYGHGEARDFHGRIHGMGAGRHVEGPAVPRARDLAPLNEAFAQGTAAVRTRAIEGIEPAADLEQCDGTPAGLDGKPATFRHIRRPRDLVLLRHDAFLRGRDPSIDRGVGSPT